MSKLLQKASSIIDQNLKGKFERYQLTENPFPSNPYVNKDSTEKKFNGTIYESSIRQNEYNIFKTNFLEVNQNDPNHLRLGFMIDSSYIGRGNGKSAFLINLMRNINENFALDLSNNLNKCFAIYFAPEGGGKVKTFEKFVDILFDAIINSNIINISLATLRYEALHRMVGFDLSVLPQDDDTLIRNLSDKDYVESIVDNAKLNEAIFANEYLKGLSENFPLKDTYSYMFSPAVNQNDFIRYYHYSLKKEEKNYFIFDDLVKLFLAANFNGAYIFIDDFERIPDFQSSIQRKDFASQLRTTLFDGSSLSSKIGFYNMIFVLHAGVPRLMQEAWELSGLEQRVPINSKYAARHNIMFEKINELHARALIKRYLDEFRIPNQKAKPSKSDLYPFTEKVIDEIARLQELNASKILQFANNLIEYAAEKNIDIIDDGALESFLALSTSFKNNDEKTKDISNTNTIDLISKAEKKE